jgi:polyphosphate kinase
VPASLNPPLRILEPRRRSAPDLRNPALYLSRELSWLEFNDRVLAQACDAAHPLLERVRFLAISAANLDEFFMIRLPAALRRPPSDGPRLDAGASSRSSLRAVLLRAQRLLEDQAHVWHDLRALLARSDIHVLERSEWAPHHRAHLARYFEQEIAPALTPLACAAGHEGPMIPGGSVNLLLALRHRGQQRNVRVQLPATLPRLVPMPPATPGPVRSLAFALLEDVVREHAAALFPGAVVESAHAFRVLRDTDLRIDHREHRSLIDAVENGLDHLGRGPIALVQVGRDMALNARDTLIRHLGIDDGLALTATRVGLADWARLAALPRPELKHAPLLPGTPWRRDAAPAEVFDRVRQCDVLVHHPFQSFASVDTFLKAAAHDPDVVAIKMTLYRIGVRSRLPGLLLEAAARGKQVTVVVELKARLDERTNVEWARRLEAGGVQVVHGFAAVKTHAKVCLVVRLEPGGLRHYAHVGSGNYNHESSRVYTDVGLFTARPLFTSDLAALFNGLTSGAVPDTCSCLVVAPTSLRATLWKKVEREIDHARAGRPARVIVKINALTDDRTIRLLYKASQAGVRVDLIVRGMCRLRPGVPGVSDHIRVRSIVGRFLEHSRLYWFANGGDDELFIGSADLMERNLGRRVEVLAPVLDDGLRAHLRDVVLDAYLRDTDRAMELDAEGRYVRPAPGQAPRFNAQEFLAGLYAGSRL